jgi:hypothetical protein
MLAFSTPLQKPKSLGFTIKLKWTYTCSLFIDSRTIPTDSGGVLMLAAAASPKGGHEPTFRRINHVIIVAVTITVVVATVIIIVLVQSQSIPRFRAIMNDRRGLAWSE